MSIGMSPSSVFIYWDDGTAIGIYWGFVSKLPILCAILVHALCDCTSKELFWKDQSRITWLQAGDANTTILPPYHYN